MRSLNAPSHPLALLGLLLLSLFLHLTQAQIESTEETVLWQSTRYERGRLGRYPRVTYKSTDIESPLINIKKWTPECGSDDYIFLSVHGRNITEVPPRFFIMDQQGNLVWCGKVENGPNHLHVQRYKGKDYLVYWMGSEAHGVGSGSYYMLDETYTRVHHIEAQNGLTGDLHAFSITDNNTAVFSSYQKKKGEIKLHNAQSAHWYDGVIQEIDIESKQVLFEWHASDHFAFNDMATSNTWAWNDGWEDKPWDWFHLNSIEKDPWGNYLISARFNNAVTYINGSNGEVIWNLGGKKNSFKDVSEVKDAATNFSCQHDARWTDNYQAVTIFDNSAFYGKTGPKARGVKIGLDFEHMTARMIASYVHPDNIQVESQGSHQVLENGHSFIGYGYASVFTEYSAEGEMLCDWQFAPLFTGGQGKISLEGVVQSYRAYKAKWRGVPAHNPEVIFDRGDTIYVTWNGATEVRKWMISGGDLTDDEMPTHYWEILNTFAKTGFESSGELPNGLMHKIYRLSAIDANESLLGEWTVTLTGTVEKYSTPFMPPVPEPRQEPSLTLISIVLVSAVLILLALKRPRVLGSFYRLVPSTAPKPILA